jgi:hypothetical protein
MSAHSKGAHRRHIFLKAATSGLATSKKHTDESGFAANVIKNFLATRASSNILERNTRIAL